jgi:hypothetical protein
VCISHAASLTCRASRHENLFPSRATHDEHAFPRGAVSGDGRRC